MDNLTSLVGVDWFQKVRTATGRKACCKGALTLVFGCAVRVQCGMRAVEPTVDAIRWPAVGSRSRRVVGLHMRSVVTPRAERRKVRDDLGAGDFVRPCDRIGRRI